MRSIGRRGLGTRQGVAAGAVAGLLAGRRLGRHLPAQRLRQLFAATAAGVAALMLVRASQAWA